MSDQNETKTPAAKPTPRRRTRPQPAGSALPEAEIARLTDDIVAGLKTVYDPEIPADIYELGLIYRIDISDDRAVTIDMTLTTPNCPAAQELPIMVENAVSSVPGVGEDQGQYRLGSAVGSEPHVGRGSNGSQHVVSCMRALRCPHWHMSRRCRHAGASASRLLGIGIAKNEQAKRSQATWSRHDRDRR